MSKFNSGEVQNTDVILKSKINLARNLDKIPFPCRMSNELRKTICKKIFASIQNSKFGGEFDYVDLSAKNDLDKRILADKGLITQEMAQQTLYCAVLVSKDEKMSIMLCEEEHMILNIICDGADIKKAYDIADKIDNIIISDLKIAFDNKLGFLTSNPMHLGSGMKASYLLYLPAITVTNMDAKLTGMVSKLGFELKPMFDGNNYLYELSNNISMGISEENAIDNLTAVCSLIVKQEYSIRENTNWVRG